jgi:hypothetical protein
MKSRASALIAISIIACAIVPASATAYLHKHHKKHVGYHAYVPTYSPSRYGFVPDRQVEYDSKKVPFGTQLWWQQFERERGGSNSSGGSGAGGGR